MTTSGKDTYRSNQDVYVGTLNSSGAIATAAAIKPDSDILAGATLGSSALRWLSAYIAGLIQAVETGSTSAAMKNYGVTQLLTTGAKTYTLPAPVKGMLKIIHATKATTAWTQTVNTSTGATVTVNTTAADQIIMKATNSGVVLMGVSTTKWLAIASVGTVTIT